MIRLVTFALVTATFLGCANTHAPASVPIDISLASKASFHFIDTRLPTERTTREEVKSHGPVTLIGDDLLPHPSEAVVKARLQQQAGVTLAGKSVSLNELEIQLMTSASTVDRGRLETSASSVPGGAVAAPIAAALISAIERMNPETFIRTRVAIKIDDKDHVGYASDTFRGKLDGQLLERNVQTALDDLIAHF